MICETCQQIFSWDEDLWPSVKQTTLQKWKRKLSPQPPQRPETLAGRRGYFHGSGQALELSTRAGCSICSKVWAYLDQDQRANLTALKPEIGIYGMNNKLWTCPISSRKGDRRYPSITFRVPQ
jgi:hypothetical protein